MKILKSHRAEKIQRGAFGFEEILNEYCSENREKIFRVYHHQRGSIHHDNDSNDMLVCSRVFLLPFWQQKLVDVDEIHRSIVRQLCSLFKGGSR